MNDTLRLIGFYYQRMVADPDDYWLRRIAQGRLTWQDWRTRCWAGAVELVHSAWEDEGSRWA